MKVDKSKWKKCFLSQLLKEYSNKNKALLCNNVFSVTNSDGFIKSTEYFDTKVFSSNLSTYKLVESGMFAYNPSRINVGSIALLESEERVIVSPLYVIFSVSNEIDPHFLLRFLKSPIGLTLINSKTSGSVRDSLRFKDLISISIPLPSLSIQQSIVAELDSIQVMIDGYKAQLADLDALAQSIFIDMFGSVAINDKSWDIIPMRKLGDLKNGLNYNKGEKGKTLKIIGVGDFKDLKSLTIFDNIPSIEVESISPEYLLQNEDIVFVRSNGNKNLVGRCLEVYPNKEEVTFSGFCIRFRKTSDIINKYLIALLTDTGFKKAHILKSNGIGIQNINQKLLGNLPIPVPPIDIQKHFAMQVEMIERQKEQICLQLADAEQLMAERMQYYFS